MCEHESRDRASPGANYSASWSVRSRRRSPRERRRHGAIVAGVYKLVMCDSESNIAMLSRPKIVIRTRLVVQLQRIRRWSTRTPLLTVLAAIRTVRGGRFRVPVRSVVVLSLTFKLLLLQTHRIRDRTRPRKHRAVCVELQNRSLVGLLSLPFND